MPDILQDFLIKADARRVFDAVSTAAGLNQAACAITWTTEQDEA